jgi:hypothetical protein
MGIAWRIYAAELPDFPESDDGLGLVSPAAVRHRVDLVQRQHPPGPSQPLSQLLQQVRLEPGPSIARVGPAAGGGLCPHRDHLLGRGRYPVPQAGADGLRHGDAPRSVDLQPGQAPGQLGARLGRPDADRGPSLLGLHQSLEPADWVSLVPQPSGPDQRQEQGQTVTPGQEQSRGKEDGETSVRSQPPHPAGIGRGIDYDGGRLVPRPTIAGQRRQCLRRGPCAAKAAGQRGPDQPRPSEGRLVRAGPGPERQGPPGQERPPVAGHGRMGPRSGLALADLGLRPIRPARDAAGQDPSGPVLHGGQGPALDHRAGPRCPGPAARPDVLLHPPGLDGPPDPLGVLREVVHRDAPVILPPLA